MENNAHTTGQGIQLWIDDNIVCHVMPDQHQNEKINAARIVKSWNGYYDLKKENEKLNAYIKHVEGKVEINEVPLSFYQWEKTIGMRHAIFFIRYRKDLFHQEVQDAGFQLLSTIPSEDYFEERFTMSNRMIGDTHLFYGQTNEMGSVNEVIWTLPYWEPEWAIEPEVNFIFWDGKYYSSEGYQRKISVLIEKYPSV